MTGNTDPTPNQLMYDYLIARLDQADPKPPELFVALGETAFALYLEQQDAQPNASL